VNGCTKRLKSCLSVERFWRACVFNSLCALQSKVRNIYRVEQGSLRAKQNAVEILQKKPTNRIVRGKISFRRRKSAEWVELPHHLSSNPLDPL